MDRCSKKHGQQHGHSQGVPKRNSHHLSLTSGIICILRRRGPFLLTVILLEQTTASQPRDSPASPTEPLTTTALAPTAAPLEFPGDRCQKVSAMPYNVTTYAGIR